MAIVVESTASNTDTTTTTITVGAPAGIQSGDLLIFTGSAFNGSTYSATFNTLSGWTDASTSNLASSVSHSCQYKVATSDDEAATDYTFTVSSSAGFIAGAVLRCSGYMPTALGTLVGVVDTETIAQSSSPTGSLSFTPIADGALAIFQLGGARGITGSVPTINNYDSTPSISFTELYDIGTGSSLRTAGTAYGIQTTEAEITAYTADFSAAMTGYSNFLVFNPSVDETGTNTLATATSTAFTQSGTCDTIGTSVLAEATTEALPQTGQATSPTQWSNETKPSTTWVNESK